MYVITGWLKGMAGEPTLAFCKVCKTSLRARKKDLDDHQKSRKHKKCMMKSDFSVNEILCNTKPSHDIFVSILIN